MIELQEEDRLFNASYNENGSLLYTRMRFMYSQLYFQETRSFFRINTNDHPDENNNLHKTPTENIVVI